MSVEVITQFYSAFAAHDSATMIACYHPEIQFSDPVFTNLKGKQAMGMWQMLVERGKDLELTFSDVQFDGMTGRCHWEATYTFSQSKRKVHNIIDATMTFRDGKIITHTDSFNFWRWSSQALGVVGMLGGWTPQLHRKVQQTAMQGLERYMLQA